MALNQDEAHAVDAVLAYLAGMKSPDDGARLMGGLHSLAQSMSKRLNGDYETGARWFDEHKGAIIESLKKLRGEDWM